jgi:hypothetical protein
VEGTIRRKSFKRLETLIFCNFCIKAKVRVKNYSYKNLFEVPFCVADKKVNEKEKALSLYKRLKEQASVEDARL